MKKIFCTLVAGVLVLCSSVAFALEVGAYGGGVRESEGVLIVGDDVGGREVSHSSGVVVDSDVGVDSDVEVGGDVGVGVGGGGIGVSF